jgi:glycosyltransferase involved in cell wall biosynthesis
VALLSRAAHPLHSPGGLERAVYHLAKHLQLQGVETVLLTRPATREGVFPGEVVTVPYGGRGPHGRVLDRTLHYPRFAARLGKAVAEMIRSGRVDVVHAQGLTALGYGRLRAKDPTLRAPLVMNPQGMEEHKTRGIKRVALTRLRALSREAARLADRVIATDESTRDEVPRLLGVDASKVVVLPNGIDVDEIGDSTPAEPEKVVHRALPSLEGAYPVFLSVGRLEAYKGFGDILRAIFEAESALPARWAWVVAGEGPERQRLTRDAFAHQVLQTKITGKAGGARGGQHVHVIGRVDEPLIHSLYERADVFVHATRFEGSSLVTLEAMAHGLPVVATRTGGIPDKVSPETGRLVEPRDVKGLSTALLELSGDAALRENLGRRARERALEHFAWPALARRTIALYEELLGARPE